MTPQILKTLTLATADLREQSYDEIGRSYRLDQMEAAKLACKLLDQDEEYASLIGLALSGWWNDVLEWSGDKKGRAVIVKIPEDFVYPSHDPVSS